MTAKNRVLAFIIALLFLALIGFRMIAGFLVDWSWFASLQLGDVFLTRLAAKFAIFGVVFGVSLALLLLNGWIANAAAGMRPSFHNVVSPWNSIEGLSPPAALERLYRTFPWRLAVIIGALILSTLIAASQIGRWNLALLYLHQTPYGQVDPLFGRDISFFLFSLPALDALTGFVFFLLTITGLFVAAIYWVHGALAFDQQRRFVAPAAIAHGSVLIALWLLVKAADFWLERFRLVYGDNGVVVGASYSDVHLGMPILWGLAGLSLLAAVLCFANLRARSLKLPLLAAAGLMAASAIIVPVATGLYQRLIVKPNELQFESPYIARNIAMTRTAYGLNAIEVKPFEGDDALNYAALQRNRDTIDNIRLLDYAPLLATYAQLQEIRTYYKFNDVDIDRYWLNGRYQQVMISAREMKTSLLAANAQTWVNQHLIFTHGIGVVMSPVTETTEGGLPRLYVKDIPPVAAGGPKVDEPRLYFGEQLDGYAVVNTTEREFDYPAGDKNAYTTYRGKDGVSVGGIGNRLLYAYYFGDVNILLSKSVTAESRVIFRRNIQDRIKQIAPFLRLDEDPYMVISGGKLYWMQDAYTVSRAFPYSKPIADGSANYIRNSVKVVVDAYNGTVDFYIADATDPLIKTYARIYPGLFKPAAAMPEDLHRHVRYPEDMFQIQADMYRAYHMQAPEVFYNREDLWQFPRRPASDGESGDARMEPYFINMRLPGEEKTEFIQMLPMVPSQKENMIAWLAARCDGADYGKLIVYTFPKDKQVYGPFQINALISQNTEVSQQISLWNQMGSRVIHGNLLVVPIDNSVLYVMPLYLRAATGQLPELKRVIAVFNGKVVMEETLAKSLAALFPAPDGSAPQTAPVKALEQAAQTPGPTGDAARAALDHYNKALAKLKAGDFAGFGSELSAMKPLLEQLSKAKP